MKTFYLTFMLGSGVLGVPLFLDIELALVPPGPPQSSLDRESSSSSLSKEPALPTDFATTFLKPVFCK